MPKLTIEIEGPDLAEVGELLDDVVALIGEGCVAQEGTYDGHRVSFAVLDTGESGEGFCNSPWAHDECEHD